MPNWLEGELKIRGTKEELKQFISENFLGVSYREKKEEETIAEYMTNRTITENIEWQIDEDLDYLIMELPTKEYSYYRIDNLRRTFFEKNDIYSSKSKLTKNELIACLNIEIAWGIMDGEYEGRQYPNDLERWRLLSEKYNLDFKFKGFEQGAEFNQTMVIIKGKVEKFEEITFEDYTWECDFSNLGG